MTTKKTTTQTFKRGVSRKTARRSKGGKLILKGTSPTVERQESEKARVAREEEKKLKEAIKAEKKDEGQDTYNGSKVVFRPNPGPQTEFLSSPIREVLFGGAAGGGKLVQKGDSILTPEGFVKVEDLRVGDEICHPKGGTQTVKHLFAWETLPKWTVHFSDGTHLDVAKEHLWFSWLARRGRKINGVRVFGEASGKVVSTEKLSEYLEKGYKPQVPVCSEQYFHSKGVQVDPYLLGVFIGDGCLTTNQITITCHEDDKEHYKKYIPTDKWDTKNTIRFGGEYREELVGAFTSYGLMYTRSATKFIPRDYLINSSEVRWAVAQGLMDTDGYSAPNKNAIYYYTVSEQLANDAASLFRSLGACVTITDKMGSYRDQDGTKVICQKVYCLYIKHDNPDKFFRMERKKRGKFGKGLVQKAVVKVEQKGTIEGRCISVSNPDGLYVTENFTVTHNSYAILVDALYGVNESDYVGLILRKTTDELRELINKSQELYPKMDPGAKWSEKKSEWRFSSGARIWMTYCDRDEDLSRFQGQPYPYVAFDELTHWHTPNAWDYLRSRNRSANPNIKPLMRATTNPGGPGHQWVKKMFIDPAPWGKPFWATDIETGETLVYPPLDEYGNPHPKAGQPLMKRQFIPSRLSDNPYLANSGYVETLLTLPEEKRRALLYGDWDVSEGAAFSEFNRKIHTCESFDVPENWKTFRACDYGYGSYTGVLWFAVSPSDQIFVVDELYVSKRLAVDLAHDVLERDKIWAPNYGVLDSSCWHKRGDTTVSIAEAMIAQGCKWRPSDRSKGTRAAGKQEIHRLLAVDEFLDEPRLIIFENCVNLIAQLPAIPVDKKNPEDVDTTAEDHLYDALRYGISSRPRARNIAEFGVSTRPQKTASNNVKRWFSKRRVG